jgi:hypothetical protein
MTKDELTAIQDEIGKAIDSAVRASDILIGSNGAADTEYISVCMLAAVSALDTLMRAAADQAERQPSHS